MGESCNFSDMEEIDLDVGENSKKNTKVLNDKETNTLKVVEVN